MSSLCRSLAVVLALIASLSCRLLISGETPAPADVTAAPASVLPPTDPASPAPTATSTAGPAALNPTGPYIVYGGPGGVWISNPDGSALSRVTSLPVGPQSLRRAISPRGDRMALIVSDEDASLSLMEVKIPGGETRVITRLYDVTADEIAANPISARTFTAYALRDYDDIAWQPGEGRLLAFMGAM